MKDEEACDFRHSGGIVAGADRWIDRWNSSGEKNGCNTIQDGNIEASDGSLITVGYDEFGYNYQAHMFNGRYCDYDRVAGGPYCDVDLIMKWNDAWLSNKDCDDDGKLDRHHGYASYIGSGAWVTNHMKQTYIGDDDKQHQWEYFVKIVAVPDDAYYVDTNGNGKPDDDVELWYTADGTEIGPSIWGQFATIQSVYNDPYGGYHGVEYLSPTSAGFGFYAP